MDSGQRREESCVCCCPYSSHLHTSKPGEVAQAKWIFRPRLLPSKLLVVPCLSSHSASSQDQGINHSQQSPTPLHSRMVSPQPPTQAPPSFPPQHPSPQTPKTKTSPALRPPPRRQPLPQHHTPQPQLPRRPRRNVVVHLPPRRRNGRAPAPQTARFPLASTCSHRVWLWVGRIGRPGECE